MVLFSSPSGNGQSQSIEAGLGGSPAITRSTGSAISDSNAYWKLLKGGKTSTSSSCERTYLPAAAQLEKSSAGRNTSWNRRLMAAAISATSVPRAQCCGG